MARVENAQLFAKSELADHEGAGEKTSILARVGQALVDHLSVCHCLHYADPRVMEDAASRRQTKALAAASIDGAARPHR